MKKLSKRFLLIALAAGILPVALVLIGLDCYAGSRDVREMMEAALSKELGTPVKIGALHYWPWSGLRATDIQAAKSTTGSDAAPPSSVVIPSVSARIALRPLFSGQVLVKRLSFDSPSLTWVATESFWSDELAEGVPETSRLVPGKPENGTVEQPRSVPLFKLHPRQVENPKESSKPERRKSIVLDFKIHAAQIENATFRFVDKRGSTIALLEGVTVHCPFDVPEKLEGSLVIDKVTFEDGMTLEGFATPFRWNGQSLDLSPIDAKLAGGSVRGQGRILSVSDHAPFTLDLLFDGVDVQQLLASNGKDSAGKRAAGKLYGNLDIYGRLGKTKSIQGTGQMKMHGGRMEQLPLLQLIGKVLLIEELTNVELQQAQLDLRADDGIIFVDSLVMESANMSLTAKGTSALNGKLDLAARLAINPKVSRQLPGWIDANFHPVPGSDRSDIAFSVTGTLSHPETDLMQVMVGQKYGNQIKNLWQSITGKKKKSGEQKKPESPKAEENNAASEPPVEH